MDSYIRFCTGNSMSPTLNHGERFLLTPVSKHHIQSGDILLFKIPNSNKEVVHRVIQCTDSGFMTRGDKASNTTDPWIITEREIIGKARIVYRFGKPYRLSQGGTGLLWHYGIRKWRQFIVGLRPLILPFYRFSSRWCYLGWILPNRFKPGIIHIKRGDHDIFFIVIGSIKIGFKTDKDPTWQIRFPWHYFIREEQLSKII